MLRILSWNVLYRDYEEKYCPKSKVLSSYPDENDRIKNMLDLLKSNVTENTIICMQEVSDLVIKELNKTFGKEYSIFTYNIRDNEHLVTITPRGFSKIAAFTNASTNGYIIVENDKFVVINCHLIPQRYSNVDVLSYLIEFHKTNSKIIIAGDFNEKHSIVKERLENYFTCPFYGNTYKKNPIDHIIFNCFGEFTPEKVHQKYISDHHMIKIDIKL